MTKLVSMIEGFSSPNPGSDAALNMGCTCPVIDNGHGRGYMGGIKDNDGYTTFVFTEGCPVHGPRTKEARDGTE